MKAEIKQETYNFWNIIIKVISSILTITTIIIAAKSFLHNQEVELSQKEREFRKELSLRQINYYSEISEVIGELLTTLYYPDSLFSKTYYSKKYSFDILYFGKMNLIKSTAVGESLEGFHDLLVKFELDNAGVKINDLQLAALHVNYAFRKSVEETINVKVLDSLKK